MTNWRISTRDIVVCAHYPDNMHIYIAIAIILASKVYANIIHTIIVFVLNVHIALVKLVQFLLSGSEIENILLIPKYWC